MALSKEAEFLRQLLQELLRKGEYINPRSQRQVWPLVNLYASEIMTFYAEQAEADQK